MSKIALSLFSGCGGMDIGVESAGFETIGAVELDIHAAETLKEWYRKKKKEDIVINEDILNIDPQIFKSDTQLDLLFGGPPCQAFSLAGKRNSLNDPRGQLLFEIIRFAKELKPKAVMVEQVKGLLSAADETGQRGSVFRTFLKQLSELGYIVKWSVLNSADYGVPQLRQRLFVVGTLEKNGFSFPNPTHSKETASTLFPLHQYKGVGEFIKDLPKTVRKDEQALFENHIDVTTKRDIERIQYVPEGGYLSGQKDAPADIVMKLTKKDTTKYRRLAMNLPSLTLRGGEIFFHPLEDRYLSPREYLRIHTFPDNFILKGPVRSRSGRVKNLDQHRQVANSVPPQLAKVIAEKIATAL